MLLVKLKIVFENGFEQNENFDDLLVELSGTENKCLQKNAHFFVLTHVRSEYHNKKETNYCIHFL